MGNPIEQSEDVTLDILPQQQSSSSPPLSSSAAFASNAIRRNGSVRRAKSLSRPERQRPRQGILRSITTVTNNVHGPGSSRLATQQVSNQHRQIIYQQQQQQQQQHPSSQPMSDHLAQQLERHRKEHLRQQQHHLLKQDTDVSFDSSSTLGDKYSGDRKKKSKNDGGSVVRTGWWAWFAFLATCCFPSCCIRVCFGKSNPMMRQAWREKITLVYIIILLCLILAYLTYGLTRTICPDAIDYYPHSTVVSGKRVSLDTTTNGYYAIFGQLYPTDLTENFFKQHNLNLTTDYGTMDLGPMFDGDLYGDCASFFPSDFNRSSIDPCRLDNPYGGSSLATTDGSCLSLSALQAIYNPIDTINFEWDEFRDPIPNSNLVLMGNYVVNLTRFFKNYPENTFGTQIDKVLHSAINRDSSYAMLYYRHGNDAMNCAIARFGVGVMQTDSSGCIASNIIMNLMFAVIIAMIVIRYSMAVLFQWVISRRLVKPGGRSNWLAWRSVQGGNADPENHIRGPYNNYTLRNPSSYNVNSTMGPHNNGNNTYQVPRYPTPRNSMFNSVPSLQRPHSTSTTLAPPLPGHQRDSLASITAQHANGYQSTPRHSSSNQIQYQSSSTLASSPSSSITAGGSSPHRQSTASSEIVQTELYTCMMVTCYSEGEEGLRITMDSLAETTYSNKHKIFFIIADGLIVGAGETKSTPDIVVDMMDIDDSMANPKPVSYLAIADGEKQLNMAKVYAGHYKGVPCITIVKCGTPEEQSSPKPGNRGKRDSQLILMSFFQRILFNDRLSELDYDIFWKMTSLMGGDVTPDKFELLLMVDADTKVLPDALTYMVAAMANDITIMGLCGETRIANKTTSCKSTIYFITSVLILFFIFIFFFSLGVTAIQVFEYYINHHYAKAFESLFGIVTCLPGCFSMYRIKAPKNGAWVPILANPDVVLEYNQNVVTTLHEKNLLLLGEDRFLSTLMLRTFPHRQMMFVPQAICKTVVPDEFMVLLSQRRRWINSTVHNLMELVLVSDLCGIACLSMQFSIFVDLIGTCVLPCAVVMTIYLIVNAAVSGNPQWQSIGLLAAVLGLPGVLIVITTRKLIYVCWMIIYICAIPVWNFILPIYSFWHFDDFSWGATRVVVGEEKGKAGGHDDASGVFDSSRLVMRKWQDWEADRTGNSKLRAYKDQRPYSTLSTMNYSSLGPSTLSSNLSAPTLGHPSP
ncbi:chitin synthase [Halteromyces radiatus]|uniref:chitin synthase n=1 Tax=Halteromyces radiatus TaxID=101107 RepID=UPI0022208653|nr:chitin synthase [Halteromyces radiatus]KAI8086467.1 chitin synthase [Halteromyces radiatus]